MLFTSECPQSRHVSFLILLEEAQTAQCFFIILSYICELVYNKGAPREAALWCLLTTDTYRDCVLKAVNLGEDTDTVAAVAGGLAGALYGYDAIPAEWLETLKKRAYIEAMCVQAAQKWESVRK